MHHPFIAFLLGLGAHHAGRIGTAAGMRLGHDESGAHLAVDTRLQPFFLLRIAADHPQKAHIAVVGRGAVERRRAEDGEIGRFINHRLLGHRQSHAAKLLRHLRRPQAGHLGFVAQSRQFLERDILMLVERFPRAF